MVSGAVRRGRRASSASATRRSASAPRHAGEVERQAHVGGDARPGHQGRVLENERQGAVPRRPTASKPPRHHSTRPSVGCWRLAIRARRVLLPQPDGPISDTNSPSPTRRLKRCQAARAVGEDTLSADRISTAGAPDRRYGDGLGQGGLPRAGSVQLGVEVAHELGRERPVPVGLGLEQAGMDHVVVGRLPARPPSWSRSARRPCPSSTWSSRILAMPKADLRVAHLGVGGLDQRVAGRRIPHVVAPALHGRLDEGPHHLRALLQRLAGDDDRRAVGRVSRPWRRGRSSTGTPFSFAWNGSDDG